MTDRFMMLRRIAVSIAVSLLSGTALLGGLTYWATPTVVVQNHSTATVQVTAHWGSGQKALPAIPPGAQRSFRVAGESAIEFGVMFPDGTQLNSQPMYFTTATTVTAVITGSSVDVSADL